PGDTPETRRVPGDAARKRPGLSEVPKPAAGGRRSAARKPHSRRWFGLKELFCSSPMRCTGGLLLVSAVVFGLVLLNISVAQTSFYLSDLQREAAELQSEQRRLRYELAKAEAPGKIVEMASSLGLVPPASQEYLEGPSILVGDRQPAGGGDPEPSGRPSR
ncbi:MAG TPA: hypothetical protein VM754_02085, partial [Actinomycetota bacterium]|nr:hypothetical protein [Actinomycetota bacterium]